MNDASTPPDRSGGASGGPERLVNGTGMAFVTGA